MRRTIVTLGVTAAALAGSVLALAQVRPARNAIMPVAEVHAGMRGYGLTVFHGTQVERFAVEVVDVLHNFRPHMDAVLIRPEHALLRDAGTIAGMSGSPVYLDDRLVGAYSFGWEYARDVVAGVTPIEAMLGELHRTRRTPAGLIPGSQVPLQIGPPVPASQRRSSWQTMTDAMVAARAPIATSYGSLTPLAVPVSVAGLGPAAMQYLAHSLEPLGMVPLQTSGAGSARAAAPNPPSGALHYVPGGAVGVDLVRGDIHLGATGTVTYVDGANVLAFGHPFMSLGETMLPTSMARVAAVISSNRRSFKVGEIEAPLGALVQDRLAAIVLDESAEPPMLPVHIVLRGNDVAAHNEWNVRVAYNRNMVGRLAATTLGSAVETSAADTGDVAWMLTTQVRTREHGTLTIRDAGASGDGMTSFSVEGLRVTEALERLSANAFEPVRLEAVEATVELRFARELYFVRSVALSRPEADPGDTVQLLVTLGQYGAANVVRSIPLPVPRELAGREVEIEVSSGIDTPAELAEPDTMADLVRNLNSSFSPQQLVVTMRMPGVGVLVRGRAVPNLPGSALDALRPAGSTDGGEPVANLRRTTVDLGRVVLGRDRVRLRVREVRQ